MLNSKHGSTKDQHLKTLRMLTIKLNEFANYSSNDFYQFLLTHNETEFMIIIPKNDSKERFDNYFILIDYYYTTYAGEILNNVADNFSYYTPSPKTTESFFFKFTCKGFDALADALHFILIGLGFDDDTLGGELYSKFLDDSNKFFDKALDDNDDTITACDGLFQIALDYLNKTNGN